MNNLLQVNLRTLFFSTNFSKCITPPYHNLNVCFKGSKLKLAIPKLVPGQKTVKRIKKHHQTVKRKPQDKTRLHFPKNVTKILRYNNSTTDMDTTTHKDTDQQVQATWQCATSICAVCTL